LYTETEDNEDSEQVMAITVNNTNKWMQSINWMERKQSQTGPSLQSN
jgi:hypothetical protein